MKENAVKANEKGFSALGLLVVGVAVLAVAGTGWFVISQRDGQNSDKQAAAETSAPAQETAKSKTVFVNPKKGAHFETSTPAHGSTLAAVPADVVIDFNFDLASNSTLKIEKDGRDYGNGAVSIDGNKLTMRRAMASDAPDGLYTVTYDGCWPDRSCHDGSFQFAIDSTLLTEYQDERNKTEITVKMSEIAFQPKNLRISAGTKVTWINDDQVEHYVNTDSHPAHSHVPTFNSKAIAPGATYSFSFEKTGAYPYHCSAHAADMIGSVIVD